MITYYVHYCHTSNGKIIPWIHMPIVRVTRNILGKEIREFVGNNQPAQMPKEYGLVQLEVVSPYVSL